MPYVDGFIVAVPKNKLADYKRLARKHGKVWREHGALAYVECAGDGVPYGSNPSFLEISNCYTTLETHLFRPVGGCVGCCRQAGGLSARNYSK